MANRLEKIAKNCFAMANTVLGVSAMAVAYGTINSDDYILLNSLKVATGTMATMAIPLASLCYSRYKIKDKDIN